jgi:hypothetical protein
MGFIDFKSMGIFLFSFGLRVYRLGINPGLGLGGWPGGSGPDTHFIHQGRHKYKNIFVSNL